jgi:hypothetical protein
VKVDRVQEKPIRTFSILKLVLENGERLPCLVDAKTWEPTRVATRWAVRYRRYHVQSSTLTDNLRVLQRIYLWAETQGQFDLDDFLTSGHRLNTRQIESLIHYLRTKGQPVIAGVITPKNPEQQSTAILDAHSFNHYLSLAADFFDWARACHHGNITVQLHRRVIGLTLLCRTLGNQTPWRASLLRLQRLRTKGMA